MTYAESYRQINNTWHLLLIVKTSEPTAFGSLISFESGDYTCIYSVNTPMRTFVEDGEYYYWFLPTSKKVIPTSEITPAALDAAYREGVNSI